MTPFISVIIPHRNDSERLSLCIQALNKQTYPREKYEIIVIDNGSDDFHSKKINTIIKNNAFLLSESKISSYVARNLGIKYAKGDYLSFTDSDCIPEKDWIKKGLNSYLNCNNCGFVGGKIELFFQVKDQPNIFELYDCLFSFRQKDYIKRHFAATANLFTSKKVFNHVGHFNENLYSQGDKEWCFRTKDKGYKIIYSDTTVVNHPARNSFREILKKQIRLCGGAYKLKKENGISPLKLFLDNIFHLIPPVVTIYRVFMNEDFKKTNGIIKKIKLIILFIFVRYLHVFESFRLLLGYDPKNY